MGCLGELYVARNEVASLRLEVRRLARLPRLSVLDLTGNPLLREREDCRPFLVFSLARLKVLDGSPVALAEVAAARGRYTGRLTVEFLVRNGGEVLSCL
jgi:hypothetical protein